jgi:hypothetical protein
VKEKDIDDLLAAQAPPAVDPAVLARVSATIGASLTPVRPLPPAWVLASALLLLSAGIAAASAFALGLNGIQKMDGVEIGVIFSALGVFIWFASRVSVAEMTPGSRWRSPAGLFLGIVAAWIAIDGIFFHDYAMGSFVPEGIPCLRAGLIVAVPAGVAAWLVLRRGFAVNRTAAGLAAGTLAGLVGVAMLELHCPNFLAMHVMVWHTAVIPVSALAGALATFRRKTKTFMAAD